LATPLLDVQNLSIIYPDSSGPICAVRDVSFCIEPGESLCLVGETGSGKSTIALALLGLLESNRHLIAGQVLFEGQNLGGLSRREWKRIRGRRISLVFQDARSSLNPVLTVGDHLVEALQAHQPISKRYARMRARELLREVRIPEPKFHMERYPFELSGGMCQRVAIALGVCNRPQLLIADEPTSALDPTIQIQILRLLREMKQSLGMALLLICHDLPLVSEIGDRLAVMYYGRIVESGTAGEVFAHPAHPYTRALIECLPGMDRSCQINPLAAIPSAAPPAGQELPGCAFAPRCSISDERCRASLPEFIAISKTHRAACLKA
jgi:oligopeptide/dipeptide ABC transporter ATP-binding protein